MSVSIPTVNVDQFTVTTPIQKAMLRKVRMAYMDAVEFGIQLASVRVAAEKAAETFEASDADDDVEAREVRAIGLDQVEELNKRVATILADIEALVNARVLAHSNAAGLSAEDKEIATTIYNDSVKTLKNFVDIYPELKDVKFPGVTQLITGKGANGASSTREGTGISGVQVIIGGKTFESVSAAVQGTKIPKDLLVSRILQVMPSDNKLEVGQQVQTAISVNDRSVDVIIVGKAMGPRGRKAGSTTVAAPESSADDTEAGPTADDLADELDDDADNDSDDESDFS